MAEKQENSKLKKAPGKMGKFLRALPLAALTLLLMAGVYVASVLLQLPGDTDEGSFVVQDDPEPVTRMQAADMNDAQALSRLFGAPLPYLPGLAVEGHGGNATHDGETVRMATLRYDGVIITAVRPASAAPLLLRGDLSVSLRSDLTVLNLPAVLSSRGGQQCVYLSSENAAYAIYAPQAPQEDFLALTEHLAWAN